VREKRSIAHHRAFHHYTVATAVRPIPLTLPAPLLRLRSDEQLLALFRAGREDAFRVIHDRYHDRLLAYVRHMLRGHSEAEDVVQDVFLRAYGGLRAGEREIAVRPWLYRVAHNRCIDYVRRAPAAPLQPDELLPGGIDPVAAAERSEDLRRLVMDLHALPEQQRSALIIRELEGLSYEELATALAVTVPAVKSLLVRARTGLAEVAEARNTDCAQIREQLALAVDRPGRPPRLLRDHLRECTPCRAHRQALRHGHAQLACLLPAPSSLLLGGWLASLAGSGGGGTAAGSGLAAGATKALAVASASVAVAGGAAEVAVHTHPVARPHAAAAATPRARTVTVAAVHAAPKAALPAPRPAPAPVQVIDADPAPTASIPVVHEEETPEPTPTAEPTATPTPEPDPTTTPTPDATAPPQPTVEAVATEATATPTP